MDEKLRSELDKIHVPSTTVIPTYGEALRTLGIRIGYFQMTGELSRDTFNSIIVILASLIDRENLSEVKMDRFADAMKDCFCGKKPENQ